MVKARIEALDGLRGYAALVVCLYHLHHVIALDGLTSKVPLLFDLGWIGVDFFFILSGFTLAHVYVARHLTGAFSLLAYARARVARIYPLHILALCMAIALGWHSSAPAGALFAELTLSQLWGPVRHMPLVPPIWSLSAEALAYVAFPFLLMTRLLRQDAGGWILIAAGLAAYLWLNHSYGTIHRYGPEGAFRGLGGFAIGAGLWAATSKGGSVTGPLLALVALTALVSPQIALLVMLAFVLYRTTRGGWLAGTASGPVARYLGEISFALYVFHWFPLMVLTQLPEDTSLRVAISGAALMVASSVLLAHVTTRMIDRPLRRAIRGPSRAVTMGDRATR